MTVLFIFLLIIISVFIAVVFRANENNLNNIKKAGFTSAQIIPLQKYITGHPDINNGGTFFIAVNKQVVQLFSGGKKAGEILVEKIKNITVEDGSTFSSRVTLPRLALVGVFAFALKKKTKNELAYLTIFWNDGKFDHETVFEYEGSSALQRANTARNTLLKNLR
jgi:hypothetical protein